MYDFVFFITLSQTKALQQLLALYVGRSYSCWKNPEVMMWLEQNVCMVLSRVDRKDPIVEEYRAKYVHVYSHISQENSALHTY